MYPALKFAIKFVAGSALLVCAASAFSQDTSASQVPQNVVQLSASGTVEVQQDLLTMVLSTSRDGSDAGVVQTQLKVALEAALVEAKKAVQPGQLDVRTGSFSLYPRYGKDGKITGWQGSTELMLEGRDFARIASTAGKISTLTLGNVSFGLSRSQRELVQGQAQTMAIEQFKTNAGQIAKGFGFASYTLREISVNASDSGGMPPRPRMMAMEAKMASGDMAMPVEAGKSTVQVTVSGAVQLK